MDVIRKPSIPVATQTPAIAKSAMTASAASRAARAARTRNSPSTRIRR
jgi:hypothetical protein